MGDTKAINSWSEEWYSVKMSSMLASLRWIGTHCRLSRVLNSPVSRTRRGFLRACGDWEVPRSPTWPPRAPRSGPESARLG